MRILWRGLAAGAVLAALLGTPLTAQEAAPNRDKERLLGQVIMEVLKQQHYRPQTDPERLSKEAFEDYLSSIDNGKRFLMAQDVAQLRQLEPMVTEDVFHGNYRLLDLASRLLEQRVHDVQSIYPAVLSEPFDFERDETFIIDPKKLDYVETPEALRERWRQALKYQTLLRYISLVEKEERDAAVFHADLEKTAREQTGENIRRLLERILKLDREDHLARYLNSITGVYDPHTSYFPPLDRDNFNIEMTGRLEGIGAQLQEEDGNIKVTEIVPGSASYRQKELEPEDLILKVAQGRDEPVDIVGMSIDDAVQLIRGPKGTEVRLTVKKPDGRIKVIPIVRDVVVLEETYARGAVIDDARSGKRFGYIELPRFYADFRREGAPEAASDVKRLLERFEEVGVDGVVLDLRNNGGGSLDEAIELTGLFIKTGPVVQVQDRRGFQQVLSDTDPDVAYDGNLLVMVNAFSASASEIVAAALQDYNRAVVVGAPATFGKGTVQRFVELDQVVPGYDELKPLGELKLTLQQFYRISGISTQNNGVTPDIILPDHNSFRDFGAKTYEHSLPGDTIMSLEFTRWNQRPESIATLAANSRSRIGANRSFALLNERLERLRQEQNNPEQSLSWRTVMQQQQQLEEESKRITDAMVELEHLTITPLEEDVDNEFRKAALEQFYKNLKKDMYVDETIAILNDMAAGRKGVTRR